MIACVNVSSYLDNEAGLVEPLPFLYPHYQGEFPGRWVFSAVLRLYDGFAGQSLQQFHPPWQVPMVAAGLQHEHLQGASQFQDALTDDARLVMHVLAEARALGACVVSHLRVLERLYSDDNAAAAGDVEQRVSGVRIEDTLTGAQFDLTCKALAQATGVWTDAAGLASSSMTFVRCAAVTCSYPVGVCRSVNR